MSRNSSFPDVEFDIVQVTPEMAKEWLSNMVTNRPLKPVKVKSYAQQMLAGLWRLNGETIKFDGDSVLFDGQHRLHAIISSNMTIPLAVARGLDRSTISSIDGGSRRTVPDNLAIIGIKNGASIAGVANILITIRESQPKGHPSNKRKFIGIRSAMDDQLAFVAKNKRDIIAGLEVVGSSQVGFPITVFAALWVEFSLIENRACADDFITPILTGAGMASGDVRLQIRNRILNTLAIKKGSRSGNRNILGSKLDFIRLMIRGWNVWITKSDVSQLKVGYGSTTIANIPTILDSTATKADIYMASSPSKRARNKKESEDE